MRGIHLLDSIIKKVFRKKNISYPGEPLYGVGSCLLLNSIKYRSTVFDDKYGCFPLRKSHLFVFDEKADNIFYLPVLGGTYARAYVYTFQLEEDNIFFDVLNNSTDEDVWIKNGCPRAIRNVLSLENISDLLFYSINKYYAEGRLQDERRWFVIATRDTDVFQDT